MWVHVDSAVPQTLPLEGRKAVYLRRNFFGTEHFFFFFSIDCFLFRHVVFLSVVCVL